MVELIARKQMMDYVMMMITATNEAAFGFAQSLKMVEDKAVRSLGGDDGEPDDYDTSFEIYSKVVSDAACSLSFFSRTVLIGVD